MAAPPAHPFLTPRRTPLVVGHRGVPRLHQENSLAGFRRAAALGVPAVELDARLTADGRVVVIHDHALQRLTGHPGDVDDLTWEQLAKLRLRRELPMGTGPDGAPVVLRYEREEPIPLLAEVLAEVGGRLAINIDLKLDFPRWWGTELAPAVAADLAAAQADGHVIVTSFDPRKLRAMARARPGVEVAFCFDDMMLDGARPVLERLPPLPWGHDLPDGGSGGNSHRVLSRLLAAHVVGQVCPSRAVAAEHTLIGPAAVQALHARGVAVGAYTLFPIAGPPHKPLLPLASDEREVARLRAAQVDWLETDDPERLMALLARAS